MAIQASIKTLKTDSLMVDRTVQRALNMSRVDTMVTSFNEGGLGILTVSHRPTGEMHIVDGQHRWEACKKFGKSHVTCKVYTGLSHEDEAALFRVLNNTKIVSALDRFRVRVVEREPSAVVISEILEEAGWRVPVRASTGTPGVVNSPVALEWVYDGAGIRQATQPNVFRQTVEIITAAWGLEPDGMLSDVVRGIGAFLTRYEGALDLSKVVRMLEEYAPIKLKGDAAYMRTMRSSSAADSVASILTSRYNRKKTVHRLPEWFEASRVRARKASDSTQDTEEG